MAKWIYEQGIGENRAILIETGAIVEAAIERPGRLAAGSVTEARLAAILIPEKRGIAALPDKTEAILEPLPSALTEGQAVRVEIVREAIAEDGKAKLARCRVSEAPIGEGPTLRQRIQASGHAVQVLRAVDPDAFEEVGWSELLEQAVTGDIPFEGGSLRMNLTPAMTLFDVDGRLAPAALARAGADAAGRAIRRFGITGSIGIDLPTLSSREDRQAAAAALDAVLPQPFERTAVNGFGFLQVVRRRERASLPELLQGDPSGAAARALLRRADRGGGSGARTIVAHPAVVARLEAKPDWLEALSRRIGAPIALRADPALAISAGHVHSAHP